MWLGDTLDPTTRVAAGKIAGLGGTGVFHHRPIPAEYVRVNLEEVFMNIPLMVPVQDADQVTLEDARGSSVLWFSGLTTVQK